MPEVVHRPLTAEERAGLEGLASTGMDRLVDLWLVVVTLLVVYIPGVYLLEWVGVTDRVWRWFLFALALLGGLLFIVRVRRDRKRFEALQAEDLADGRAEVATYRATDAIRVEELEDEGSSYFLRLAEGGVLFLTGQYLYDEEEDGRFPSTSFRTTRSTPGGHLLDFEVLGEPLPVSSTRASFTVADHQAGRVPDDGEVVDLDFDELRAPAADSVA